MENELNDGRKSIYKCKEKVKNKTRNNKFKKNFGSVQQGIYNNLIYFYTLLMS